MVSKKKKLIYGRMKMNKKGPEKKLSKRAVLYISNGIAFIIIAAEVIIQTITSTPYDLVEYLSYMFIFLILSLVIYYLSVISEALDTNEDKNAQNRIQNKNNSKRKK